MANRPLSRREKLRLLANEPVDLLVVGGGINGAGIAREAAMRGLRVALIDKGDFASGTSSRSSKLIHGGVRYLETGDIGLVFESSRERDLLRRKLAPHLVQPLRFFFPVYRTGPVGYHKLRAGLVLYDLLAAFRNIQRHQMVPAAKVAAVEPTLRAEGLRGGALYYDCFTDDARLVLETVLASEEAGALCLNYVGLEAFDKTDGSIVGVQLRDLDAEGGSISLRPRAVVNATGPWLDRVRRLDDPKAASLLRPTKGVHVIVPRERVGNQNAVVLHSIRDRRVLFVLPWQDHTMVGTTDTDYQGSPDLVAADEDDVRYLLETVNFHFPKARLTENDVVSTVAGLRPLVASGADRESPSEVSREEEIFESESGLVSLGGGKLTTYRRIAIKVVNRIARRLERELGIRTERRSGTDRIPLPGGLPIGGGAPANPLIPAEAFDLLTRRYGSRATLVWQMIERSPDLARPLVPQTSDLKAEARFAASREMALRIEDVLRRRTHVALRTPDQGVSAAETTANLMAAPLDWDPATTELRAREYVEEATGAAASRKRA